MKSTTLLLKGNLLLLATALFFSLSCKKEHSNLPFVAPVALPGDVGIDYFVASWTEVGATSYNLFVATASGFTQPLNNYNPMSVNGVDATVSGVPKTTTYFFRVEAVNSKGATTPFSNTIKVTTGDTSSDRYVYIGGKDQNVYCFSALSGGKIWSYATGADIESSATLVNGSLYIGGTTQRLYKLDALTGNVKWAALTQGAIVSTPAYDNGSIYVDSYSGNVFRIDTGSGKETWKVALSGGEQSLVSSPAVANGIVYVGGEDHNLY